MFVEPMLARAAEEADLANKDWTGWVLEPKHDGMRAIVERTETGVDIYSRTGKSQNGKLPHLEASLMALPIGTVLDGEVAFVTSYIDVFGKSVPVVDFNKTMRVMGAGVEKAAARATEIGKLDFLIFDVIQYNWQSYETATQDERFEFADNIELPHVIHNPRFEGDFDVIYNTLIKAGVEGAILKETSGMYLCGKRSKTWLKVKSAKTFDVVVMGFTDGQGKYEGQIGAIQFGAYTEEGTLKYVGRCSGMTDEERKQYTITRARFWDQDPIVIEVKANEMVGSGAYRTPRHPQYVCARIDKNASDCTMEQFKA
jgi:bifunctional non-homologous end joining protein LigD